MISIIVVLDIGKTNVKLCALEMRTGVTVETLKRSNEVVHSGDYPRADIEGIWQWYCEGLRQLGLSYHISRLAFTTHGATAVCLSDERLALGVLDYESDLCESTDSDYARCRPRYDETLSPALNAGLNLGRQLYWLSKTYPSEFSKVDCILMYPQYWGWRLSGVKANEVTSLGCHTDLWNPHAQRYSSLVESQGWEPLFAPMKRAGEVLGSVKTDLAVELGLPSDCQVINGIHDSNASLVPYLRQAEAPFTVISTGTWVVIAAVGGPLSGLSEQDDMLANVSAYGQPIPCIRFMGGREWELLRGEPDCDFSDLEQVLKLGVLLLPAFSRHGGPFRHLQGEVVGPLQKLSGREHTVLASLYCALVSHYCLNRVGSAGDIYIEGSFARNEIYLQVLQCLRPCQVVRVSEDSTGTTQGAAQLLPGCDWAGESAVPVVKLDLEINDLLISYYERWLGLVIHRLGDTDRNEGG